MDLAIRFRAPDASVRAPLPCSSRAHARLVLEYENSNRVVIAIIVRLEQFREWYARRRRGGARARPLGVTPSAGGTRARARGAGTPG